MDVDLRRLRYFVAVAEDLNFTHAAQRLYISQPSLSKQIRELERDLQVELLHRSSQQVALTGAGAALLEHARQLLAGWDAAMADARDLDAHDKAALPVGFVSSGAQELTPRILRRFAELRPGWRVVMSQAPWSDPTAGLAAGTVKAAILRLPIPGQRRFHTRTLIIEPRVIALPSSHPLAAQDVVGMHQLLDEPFIATPREAGAWRDYWLAADERGGRPVVIGGEAKTPDEWLEAIVSGQGISFSPLASTRYYTRPGLTYRPVDGVSNCKTAVAWPRHGTAPAVDDFVRACVETAHAGHR